MPEPGLEDPPLPMRDQTLGIIVRFIYTVAAVVRGLEQPAGQLGWAAKAADDAAAHVANELTGDDVGEMLDDPEYGPGDWLAFSILLREMVYFNRLYAAWVTNPLAPEDDAGVLKDVRPRGAAAVDGTAAERAETIIGSIEKIFNKLPAWLKRILHVAQELLKLARLG